MVAQLTALAPVEVLGPAPAEALARVIPLAQVQVAISVPVQAGHSELEQAPAMVAQLTALAPVEVLGPAPAETLALVIPLALVPAAILAPMIRLAPAPGLAVVVLLGLVMVACQGRELGIWIAVIQIAVLTGNDKSSVRSHLLMPWCPV